jgi:uncharacterized protein (TIGR00661 family)
LALLKKEFPALHYFEIVSYHANYPVDGNFLWKLFLQVPKFLKAIRKEKKDIEKIIDAHAIDLIISDNRFGCRANNIKSIFITHQVNLLPQSATWLKRISSFWNIHMIKKFDQCWVPDLPHSIFSGVLSKSKKIELLYIGILSRFKVSTVSIPYKYKLMGIVSGPEPQRKIFEDLIRSQSRNIEGEVLLVKGLPDRDGSIQRSGTLTETNHLNTQELEEQLNASEFIICRSGYSSVMDLIALGKHNIIMVPTPGQPEQEYLAARLMENQFVYISAQHDLNLVEAMIRVKEMKGFSKDHARPQLLKKALDEVLLNLQAN